MIVLWVIIAVAVAVAAIVIYMTTRKKNVEETPQVINQPQGHQIIGSSVKLKNISSSTWYMCIKDIKPYEAGIVYLGADIDPAIKMWERYFREATEAEIEEQHPKPKPEPLYEPKYKAGDVLSNINDKSIITILAIVADQYKYLEKGYTDEADAEYDFCECIDSQYKLVSQGKVEYDVLEDVLDKFQSVIKVEKDSLTYNYIVKVYDETYLQYYDTQCTLPWLYVRANFPVVYDYWGDFKDEDAAFKTMVGWLIALQLSELCPQKRNYILKIGYEAGGYTMNSPIYGYDFYSDPNVARLVASVIYVGMRSILKPNTDAMRKEVGGTKYDKTLYNLWDVEPRNHVTDDAFYIDLRKFMASAPAPYAPAYSDRSKNNPTFPDAKTENGCLQMDMDIHNFIVESENLPKQSTVQAIADKDWDTKHFFGYGKINVHGYNFNAVFGEFSIGEYIAPNGKIADFINLVKQIGGSARGILQHADPSLGAIEYGRLRPACSWEQECKKHSETDNRWNASTDWFIEDGDGNPTGYYDANGNWTQPDKVDSPEDFEEIQRTELYANSYPSGHSSGCWCGGMSLTEIYPYKADLILREMFLFSTNRSITRFHWTSDIIQGRIVGSAMNAICHAAKDYDELLKNVKM